MKYRSLIIQGISIAAIAYCLCNTGCASLGLGYGDEKDKDIRTKVVKDSEGNAVQRFSQNPNTYYPSDRQYRKMTKNRMEEESELHSQAGSMWVMEGQGAYLFTQNKARRDGDLLNIQIDGAAQKQVETKVSVIKKLLRQLEEEQEKQTNPAANQNATLADNKTGGDRAPASVPAAAPGKKDEKEDALTLEVVPTRIVERLPDGNYRIKGAQPFMIGKREYKVLITGMIRPDDFNDQAPVSSAKLLDPQYDVVSIRRSEKQ